MTNEEIKEFFEDELKHAEEHRKFKNMAEDYYEYFDKAVEAYQWGIKVIESQRWIPVSEKLPEKQTTIGEYVFSENVLGTEGFTIRKAYYNYTTKEWFDGNAEMEWTEITHWMPLPEEPPKAESEDEK